LTYACENGHTDVAEVLLYFGAELEHLSEGGRTPLMKACRAGHICTVKFLIQKGADVNRQTTNNDHTPLSLACAGGHQQVVELLLAHIADPFHKLKDNSTMLIEAAKGGHTGVVQLLLDFNPTAIPPQQNQPIYIPAPMPHQASQLNMAQMKHQQQQQLKMLQQQQQQQHLMAQQAHQQFMVAPPGLHEVTEVIRLPEPPGMFQPQADMMQNQNFIIDPNAMTQSPTESSILTQMKLLQSAGFKDGLAYGLTKAQSAVNQMVNQQTTTTTNNMNVAPCGNQHQPMITNNLCMTSSSNKQKNVSRKKCSSGSFPETQPVGTIEVRSAGVGEEEENVSQMKSTLDKVS
jgi:ankyrin repeat domain-containing protein 17